jgi:glycosyltransferase involved in cell wall biosynthesis
MAAAVERRGIPVWKIDVTRLLPGGDENAPQYNLSTASLPPYAPLVLHVTPPLLPWILLRLPRTLLRGRRVIGYWAWELPVLPKEWRDGFDFVHEVWAPSVFTATAIARDFRGRVGVVPHPVADSRTCLPAFERSDFDLPTDTLIVLTSFNLNSSLVRKNPNAAIAAFRAAFGDRSDCLLLLKIGNSSSYPSDFESIRAATSSLNNVRIETRMFKKEKSDALTACCDIVLSLHRSEGFGLVPAEAMLLAKPVVSTNWSATAEFVTSANGIPVPYTLVPANDPRGVYDVPGAFWAEPDINAAANALRMLADDGAKRAALGNAGRIAALSQLTAHPLSRALNELGILPPPQRPNRVWSQKSSTADLYRERAL